MSTWGFRTQEPRHPGVEVFDLDEDFARQAVVRERMIRVIEERPQGFDTQPAVGAQLRQGLVLRVVALRQIEGQFLLALRGLMLVHDASLPEMETGEIFGILEGWFSVGH
jgi:hypothetical protein